VNLHEILAMLRTEGTVVERSIKVLERLEQQPKVWPWSKVDGAERKAYESEYAAIGKPGGNESPKTPRSARPLPAQ
jgi:hypothetical protein